MKTDDLIAALSADTVAQPTVAQRLARSMPVALLVSVTAFLAIWGVRAELGAALASPVVLKTLSPALLFVLAGAGAVALAHPGVPAAQRLAALWGLCGLIAAAFAFHLLRGGLAGLVDALSTISLLVCLVSVPVLSLPFIAAMMWSLNTGAVLRPRLAGAVAGLAAGGASATIYSLYCDQDAALFVLPAYSVAILAVALGGAWIGPRVLRW